MGGWGGGESGAGCFCLLHISPLSLILCYHGNGSSYTNIKLTVEGKYHRAHCIQGEGRVCLYMCVCCLSAWEREPFNLWSEQRYASVRPPYPRHCRCRVHNLLNVTVSSGERGWRLATPPPEERDRQRTREKQGSIGALMPVCVCV